MYTTYHPNFS